MIVIHCETKKRGVWLGTRDSELIVWNVDDSVKESWPTNLTECSCVKEEDKNDEFKNLLYALTSPRGLEVINESELMLLATKSIAYFLEEGYLKSKDTLEESIKLLQEVLYSSLGEGYQCGPERDEILLFIHQKLPCLIQGAYWGYALSPIAQSTEDLESKESREPESLCEPKELESILLEKKPLTYYGCCGKCFGRANRK
jgi:hypothetical protein